MSVIEMSGRWLSRTSYDSTVRKTQSWMVAQSKLSVKWESLLEVDVTDVLCN